MTGHKQWGARAAVAGLGTALVIAGSLAAPAQAAPAKAAAPDECPAAVPVSSVTAGMIGEGLTVVKGTTPSPFKVEVLGVLKDGIGAGRDMIMIKVSDLPGQHVIDQGAGIWSGMSGSPVYVDGKLLGAVAWGFSTAPSVIGGLTPAEDMYKVLDLPDPKAAAKARFKAASTVSLSAAQRKAYAAKAGVATPTGSLRQITVPMAVSGLSGKRIAVLQKAADKAGMSVRMYAAGRASAPSGAPAATPTAGGNFAAMLAYGDVSIGGIGTTTAVCGNKALAFGHPLQLSGPAGYGANDADTVTIVDDATLGALKMANVTESFGTVNQDRSTALGADLTTTPKLAQINTVIHNADTGRQRSGTTGVTTQSFLPDAAVSGIWANDDAVFDEWGDGVATSDWTISGTRAGGKPFSVSHGNRWAAQDDVTVEPAFDVADVLYSLIYNDTEKITIDKVDFESTKSTTFQQLHIAKIQVKVNAGKYSTPKKLALKAGDKLKIRVYVANYRETATKVRTLALTVPAKAKGRSGSLSVAGGLDLSDIGDDEGFTMFGARKAADNPIDEFLKSVAQAPRNDAIRADLRLSNGDDDPETVATTTKLASLTVSGGNSIRISVKK